MKLKNVVPWGRSHKEYREMFSLSQRDLKLKILGCSDGPASFNAEGSQAGESISSLDPLYQFDVRQIASRIEEVYPQVMSQVSLNKEKFLWKSIIDLEELGRIRMKAMKLFLGDYECGTKEGRYVNASLPDLPCSDNEFDLALCSHYLFLYSEQIDEKQHIKAMKELCRVAREVRIYPLVSLEGKDSDHLHPVIKALTAEKINISFQSVTYQFQKGATKMLVAKR